MSQSGPQRAIEISALELAKRLEHGQQSVLLRFAAIQRRYRSGVEPAALPIAGGYAFFAGKESLLTRAVGLGMEGPVTSSDMDSLEDFFRSRGAEVQVEVVPSAHPSLLSLAQRRGYQPREMNAVLVRGLADMALHRPTSPASPSAGEAGQGTQGASAATAYPAASGIEVRAACFDEAELWTRVFAHSYFESVSLRGRHMPNLPPLFHLPEAQPMIAYLDGQPAGASCASLAEDRKLALLFGAGTLPQFRGRGIHRAMIACRLAWAGGLGAAQAMLSTLPHSVSYRNARRFGFNPVYDKMTYVSR